MAEENKTEETKPEEVKEESPVAEEPKAEVKEEKPEQKEEPKKEEPKKEEKEDKKPEADEKVEVPKKFEKIVNEIEGMKVVDLAELVKILEKKFGVSAAAPVAIVAASGSGPEEAGESEKSEYDIILKSVGDKKIEVIKAVRDATGKGLKEAKDVVDAAATEPQTIKEKAKKEDAEEMKKKFEAAGAGVELK